MFRRARSRLHLSLLVLAALLFQHAAVAAFACESRATPPPEPAATAHCPEMGTTPVQPQSPALCEEHCSPDQSVPAEAAALHVPAPALPMAYALVLHVVRRDSAEHRGVTLSRSDPPPRLRYCSLLI